LQTSRPLTSLLFYVPVAANCRNSTEPTSTSTSRKLETTIAPDESKDNLLQTKSSAKAKLGHELNAQDLEAGLLIFEAQQLITSEA
jgi:hypothetical protein